MKQQDIIAIQYISMPTPLALPPSPTPKKVFDTAFQFTIGTNSLRYGHTHWRDLWLVILGTPPAPLLSFHFRSKSRFTCSKTITCDRIASGKKKKKNIPFFFQWESKLP